MKNGYITKSTGITGRMKSKLFVMTLASVMLAGCVSPGVELPQNSGSGADKLKLSPCACNDQVFPTGSSKSPYKGTVKPARDERTSAGASERSVA